MQREINAKHQARSWTLLLVACGVVWFAVLGIRPLFNPDEGRYAQIPAEMLATGDYTVPHLNGLIYLEKPPLQYWATALTLKVFGHNEWGARSYTAGTAAAMVWFIYLLGVRGYSRERGLLAALMTSSMLLFVFMGQLITLDMALASFLTLACISFAIAQLQRDQTPSYSERWMLLCWTAMAAATLTKGLVGIVIPGTVLLLYTLWQRDTQTWRHLALSKGIAIYALLVVPWFIAVERAEPGAVNFLIVREHFQRYLTRMHERYHPWWYFMMILAVGSLPWIAQIARALAQGWRATAPSGRFDLSRLLWVNAVFTLVFFSLSDSKLPPYILPILPPLALLGARLDPSGARDLKVSAWVQGGLACALGLAIVLYGQKSLVGDQAFTFSTLRPWLIAIAVMMCLLAAITLWQLKHNIVRAAQTLGAGGFLIAITLIIGAANGINQRYSAKTLLAAAGPLEPNAPIYTVDTFDWTMPFYTQRPVVPVVWRGELDYGLNRAPELGIATVAEFESHWQSSASGYALIPQKTYALFLKDALPMRALAQDFDNVFVSRR